MDDKPTNRVCTKCGVCKPLAEYYAMKHGKHGTKSQCKSCCIKIEVERNKSPEGKARRASAFKVKYHQEPGFKEALKERDRAYRATETGRVNCLQRTREYQARNPEKVKERSRIRQAERHKDPLVRCQSRIRVGLRKSLITGKSEKTFKLLGYTAEQLHDHLEKQFLPGMGWHNMDEWHIDHIVPLSSFSIDSEEDPKLRRAWCLTNLRPLWAADNMQKHAKLTHLI